MVEKIIVETSELWCLEEEDDSLEIGLDPVSGPHQPASKYCTAFNQSVIRTIHPRTILDDIFFSRFQFPPFIGSLHHLDSSKLQRISLSNCTNIGYFFNSLLCSAESLALKFLTISQEGLQRETGYSGKAKLENLLSVHEGIEVVEFVNLGANMPCLEAILCQSPTLRCLKLVETKREKNSGFEKARYEYDLEHAAAIRAQSPHLNTIVIDLESNSSKSNTTVCWIASAAPNLKV